MLDSRAVDKLATIRFGHSVISQFDIFKNVNINYSRVYKDEEVRVTTLQHRLEDFIASMLSKVIIQRREAQEIKRLSISSIMDLTLSAEEVNLLKDTNGIIITRGKDVAITNVFKNLLNGELLKNKKSTFTNLKDLAIALNQKEKMVAFNHPSANSRISTARGIVLPKQFVEKLDEKEFSSNEDIQNLQNFDLGLDGDFNE